MKIKNYFKCIISVILIAGCTEQAEIDKIIKNDNLNEPFYLFNGTNFDGWNVDTNYFHVSDSMVVGGTLQNPIEDMVWMTTKKQYSNFILDVDVKILGGDEEEYPNGGIWFRCFYDDEKMLIGYEADMMINNEVEDSIWWGSLHDPFRRDFDVFNIVGNQDSLKKYYKPDEWNHFKIYCNEPEIKIWLNDFLTAKFIETDTTIEASGIIGIQLHDGPPCKVWYKNIILKQL